MLTIDGQSDGNGHGHRRGNGVCIGFCAGYVLSGIQSAYKHQVVVYYTRLLLAYYW